jgi:hypothetical protein
MPTYDGVLKDDHIEWADDISPQERPVRIRVTIIEEDTGADENTEAASNAPTRGENVADIMAKIAERVTFNAIDDPVQWQREIRKDRPIRPSDND